MGRSHLKFQLRYDRSHDVLQFEADVSDYSILLHFAAQQIAFDLSSFGHVPRRQSGCGILVSQG